MIRFELFRTIHYRFGKRIGRKATLSTCFNKSEKEGVEDLCFYMCNKVRRNFTIPLTMQLLSTFAVPVKTTIQWFWHNWYRSDGGQQNYRVMVTWEPCLCMKLWPPWLSNVCHGIEDVGDSWLSAFVIESWQRNLFTAFVHSIDPVRRRNVATCFLKNIAAPESSTRLLCAIAYHARQMKVRLPCSSNARL